MKRCRPLRFCFLFCFLGLIGVHLILGCQNSGKSKKHKAERTSTKTTHEQNHWHHLNLAKTDLESLIELVARETGQRILYDATIRGQKISFPYNEPVHKDDLLQLLETVVNYEGYIFESTGEKDYTIFKVKRILQGPWSVAPVVCSAPIRRRCDVSSISFTGHRNRKTWKRSQITPNTSRLMIGDKEALPLKSLQVTVRIDGFRARVLLDCYFYNDRDRILEGTFKLRLPNEASPYFLAFGQTTFTTPDHPALFSRATKRQMGMEPTAIMDARRQTWTQPKEARMVPREKAAYAYTEIVRQRVDPALMEWAGAGIFSARVFPLAPKRLHRIVIGYDVNLLQVGNDLEYRFDLPAALPHCVVDFNVAAMADMTVEMEPLVTARRTDGRLFYRVANPQNKTITVRLKNAGTVLLQGTDPQTAAYFATVLRPTLPASNTDIGPTHAVFLVDVSLSMHPERFNVWLKLLHAILDNNRDRFKTVCRAVF